MFIVRFGGLDGFCGLALCGTILARCLTSRG